MIQVHRDAGHYVVWSHNTGQHSLNFLFKSFLVAFSNLHVTTRRTGESTSRSIVGQGVALIIHYRDALARNTFDGVGHEKLDGVHRFFLEHVATRVHEDRGTWSVVGIFRQNQLVLWLNDHHTSRFHLIQGRYGPSQFALQRFPQREAGTNSANCSAGWYTASETITGDDGSHATQAGGWYDTHREEVLVVPFPGRSTVDNSEQILRWLDLKETLGPTDEPCDADIECDGGACGQVNGEGRCFAHDNPELRAGGGTPLGKSIFYAGEYLRRFVAVDGKACVDSEDCGSVGYVCADQVCRDPYASCREHFIILFTDGAESQHVSTSEFFNPVVQAKRLAFGLGCDDDDGCRGGATCVDGRCEVPDVDPFFVPTLVDFMGEDALVRPDGTPLRVQVSVVTLESQESDPAVITQNERIALVGGGTSLNVLVQDPEAVQEALLEVRTPALKWPPDQLRGQPSRQVC